MLTEGESAELQRSPDQETSGEADKEGDREADTSVAETDAALAGAQEAQQQAVQAQQQALADQRQALMHIRHDLQQASGQLAQTVWHIAGDTACLSAMYNFHKSDSIACTGSIPGLRLGLRETCAHL